MGREGRGGALLQARWQPNFSAATVLPRSEGASGVQHAQGGRCLGGLGRTTVGGSALGAGGARGQGATSQCAWVALR